MIDIVMGRNGKENDFVKTRRHSVERIPPPKRRQGRWSRINRYS